MKLLSMFWRRHKNNASEVFCCCYLLFVCYARADGDHVSTDWSNSARWSSMGPSLSLVVGLPALVAVLIVVVAIFCLCRRRDYSSRKTKQPKIVDSRLTMGRSGSNSPCPYDKAAYVALLQSSSQPPLVAPSASSQQQHPMLPPGCYLPPHHSPPPSRATHSSGSRWPGSTTPSSHVYQMPMTPRESIGTGFSAPSMATDASGSADYQSFYSRGVTTPTSSCWSPHQRLPSAVAGPASLSEANIVTPLYRQQAAQQPTYGYQTHLHYGQCWPNADNEQLLLA